MQIRFCRSLKRGSRGLNTRRKFWRWDSPKCPSLFLLVGFPYGHARGDLLGPVFFRLTFNLVPPEQVGAGPPWRKRYISPPPFYRWCMDFTLDSVPRSLSPCFRTKKLITSGWSATPTRSIPLPILDCNLNMHFCHAGTEASYLLDLRCMNRYEKEKWNIP